MGAGQNLLQATQAKTRLLLALWDLGGIKQEVKKGQLTKRIISKGKKVADFKDIIEELQAEGAIAISKTGYSLNSPKGLEVLGEGLKSGDFKFEGTIVGTWAANALVRWISQIDVSVGTSAPVNEVKSANIASYDEFKSVALEVYDKLNQNHSLDDLVPIYRIRREIGDRVSREKFNKWLIEMQADDILQLMTGEIPDFTADKREDSISIAGTQLRSYAKRLS
ncbi:MULTISPECIES: hypothetical protein [Cyanophyceae]|uniref:Uncharacterized protein n=1 Tax=Nodularia spumigena CENA596 TaxID=1819295 RepID=A0A161VTT9_NODSP|nr:MULTISPECIES: hypothetical protein [Cyanophyceae]MDB9358083.1 hypothetical protein [Nodularia spumigena CS-587/03]KZL50715.1 hypothetical protein A2T98_06070 [Nodularia spumigena CENA596]MDB9306633.1 hypothetical protein [Nodularia spumigena CS-591/12]MDB9316130.1 hypothetical protein [Nodularia spumigena CS-590/01A]MDB9321946.1 hypothetical protein [Nodularia spumigena CS-591/07A]